ncbi:MAG TPA: M20 family metallopeptidase [Candidatus Dormibacteraeota bacterium]|nr:M20 family metallopeptidase [Candidatus Dormibacteraeota bacterium]
MSDAEARIRAAVDAVHEEVVETRRTVHRRPELSHREHETAKLAATRCEQLGFTVRTGLGGTGVIADLIGSGEGPMLMLRADMDALPVLERDDGRTVRSEVDGVMHACGHDGHVAMALGAGTVLASLRDAWQGTVRLCFQPAEEMAQGAVPMIDDGALDGVDKVLGIHLWAPLEAGHVAVTDGTVFGSADSFRITVRGIGGHGGMPHTAVDPIVAAAEIVVALQGIVSRETSPFAPAVVTIGRVEGGTAMNVIADSAELLGTSRALVQEERERILRRVREVAEHVARGLRCEAEFEHTAGCRPVVSDADSAELVRSAAVATVGEDHVRRAQPVTVGDDVGELIARTSGCYFLVGAGKPGTDVAPHHSAGFDIDERCLPVGVETLVRASLATLR